MLKRELNDEACKCVILLLELGATTKLKGPCCTIGQGLSMLSYLGSFYVGGPRVVLEQALNSNCHLFRMSMERNVEENALILFILVWLFCSCGNWVLYTNE